MIPLFPYLGATSVTPARADDAAFRRVRPSDPDWPNAARWEELNRDVGGRLIKVQSPLARLHGRHPRRRLRRTSSRN